MASTFTTNLGLQKQGTGDNPGTWGANLNTNVIDLLDSALGAPYAANVAGSSDVTLSATNAGNLIHNLTGILTGNINYIFPATAGRFLIIKNATTGSFTVTVKPSGGTGVVIPQGTTQFIYIDSSATTAYAPVSISGLGGLAVANNLSDVANAATALSNLGGASTSSAFSSGDFVWSALSSKTGFLLCYGQAVSRSTYSTLFSAISTTFGTGDGSTTFNLPDGRGRTFAGVDNMGGSAASRITSAVSSLDGTTLGAAGGNQAMQSHTHTASVTDGGHVHQAWVQRADTSGNIRGANATSASSGQSGATASDTNYNTASAVTGITVSNTTTGSGASQNIPPTMMMNLFIKT